MHATLEITESLKKAMEKKLFTCAIFLDFSKAFDTIDLGILLQKLNHYGIRGTPFKWLENYLWNRVQHVKIGDAQSSYQTITCPIPQGSTLGLLLFWLCTNDLPNCSKRLSFRIFADDTNIFCTSDNLKHLKSVMNEALDLVFKYNCSTNRLSVNLVKTKYMLISSSRLRAGIPINDIEQKSEIKYLGVYILIKI